MGRSLEDEEGSLRGSMSRADAESQAEELPMTLNRRESPQGMA